MDARSLVRGCSKHPVPTSPSQVFITIRSGHEHDYKCINDVAPCVLENLDINKTRDKNA